ncbi:aspartyl protease family protein [Alistipes finegoldii]|uniref:aspartyl protease family protein n=1 Tax=Alistipes finegoldii TaxID=214856 RepID=UPI003AB2CF8D
MAIDFLFQPLDIPLLIVKAQAKNLCFLLDTGSNINILDKKVAEFFQLSGGTAQQQQFGIDGTLQTTDVVKLTFSLEEREYKADFSVMDLSSAFGKVEEESGIQIHGLLGCSFMEQQKWVLDFENLTLCLPS